MQLGRWEGPFYFLFSFPAWVHSLPLGEPGSKTCQMHQNLPNKVPFTSQQSGDGTGVCWERWVWCWLSGLRVVNRVHISQNNALNWTPNSLEIKSLSWSGKTGAKEIKQCNRGNLGGLMGVFLWVCWGIFLRARGSKAVVRCCFHYFNLNHEFPSSSPNNPHEKLPLYAHYPTGELCPSKHNPVSGCRINFWVLGWVEGNAADTEPVPMAPGTPQSAQVPPRACSSQHLPGAALPTTAFA